MKKLYLSGKNTHIFTLVDDEDFERCLKIRWYLSVSKKGFNYVRSGGHGEKFTIHRFIMKSPKGVVVDHKNHNPFDNQKNNLRLCTFTENNWNRKSMKRNTSRFKGVSLDRGAKNKKWRASIMINKKSYHLGYFTDKIEAAKAYNEAAKIYHGEFAYLNRC